MKRFTMITVTPETADVGCWIEEALKFLIEPLAGKDGTPMNISLHAESNAKGKETSVEWVVGGPDEVYARGATLGEALANLAEVEAPAGV